MKQTLAMPEPSIEPLQEPLPNLLQRAQSGDTAALQALYAQLYPDIKRVAHARLARTGGAASDLSTTALVHEGFLRMAQQQGLQGESIGQFFGYVGQVLRSVVIDHLRSQGRDKRGGDQLMLTLSAAEDVAADLAAPLDMLALDRALKQMATIDRPLYELLEMLFFAGLTIAEAAELLGVSSRTVNRDLQKARALLRKLLG
jgi:RNA polymerase sigma factor (TIGR02999 family)